MKNHFIKSVKIAVAALLAIFIAGELGLKYSATAGIITILSIRNTKKETLHSAGKRAAAYICALVLAAVCFRILGYSLPAFAVYLFGFAFLCMIAGWQEAIATDSVLISHFLAEKSMAPEFLLGETLLFVIGTGIGILMNLHLRRKEEDFEKLADEVDSQIKGILHRMSKWLPKQDRENYKSDCFDRLEETIRQAKLCAAANYNNSFFQKDTFELDYIRMREQQSVVLKGIYKNIKQIFYLPVQTHKIAAFLSEIEQAYHKENTVKELLEKLQKLENDMKQENLPQCREEFEARAILFYILLQLEELLYIKLRFIEEKNKG